MSLLVAGILLWALFHLSPALAPVFRQGMIDRLGENAYKAAFAVGMAVSLLLIIKGWKSAPVNLLYVPPQWGRHATALLVLFTFITLLAPYTKNNVRRTVRHPQLLGVAAWGAGHLLANGEWRSVVLFGAMIAWALLEIPFINRREGAWSKPEKAPLSGDILLLVKGVLLYLLVLYFHAWLFGVSPMPA